MSERMYAELPQAELDRAPVVMPSAEDQSVNFVWDEPSAAPGKIEARYVRRCDDYFIAYLSSQTGCEKACRFCHLTQSGQTQGAQIGLEEYVAQAEQVLAHYRDRLAAGDPKARVMHFNFMSRGEALANPALLERGDEVCARLSELATREGLIPKIKVSSIFPREIEDLELTQIFPTARVNLYLSLYSVDPEFRRRWMPKAIDPHLALEKLARWQRDTRQIPVIHWALIEGENDSPQTISDLCEAVRDSGAQPDVNIVRYNPFSARLGQETPAERVREISEELSQGLPWARIKVVSRVGFDVKASCGMFVPGPDRRGRVRLADSDS